MIKFSNNSWHFKLANFGKDRVPDWLETDICRYTRAVIAGAVWAVFCIVVTSAILSLIGFAIYENYLWIVGEKLGPVGFIADITLFVILALVALEISKDKIRKYSNQKYWAKITKEKQPDNFLYTVYLKFKEKTCYKVIFDKDMQ